VEVIVLQKLGAAVFQNFGMDAPPLELRLDCARSLFGFIESPRSIAGSELTVLSIFQAGKRQDGIELLTRTLERFVPTNEASRDKEGLDEIDHAVCASVTLLTLEKDAIQPPPFC
jgi:hypothetical protein